MHLPRVARCDLRPLRSGAAMSAPSAEVTAFLTACVRIAPYLSMEDQLALTLLGVRLLMASGQPGTSTQ